MISKLQQFERSSCSCRQCVSVCTSGKPGCLAPGDIDNIAEFIGLDEATESFIADCFEATLDGPQAPTDEFPSGETYAIRPKVTSSGKCVFYNELHEECLIHQVKPFECSRVNECDPTSGAAARRALGVAHTESPDQAQLWFWLYNRKAST